ncbi:MAG: hypothetical protein ACOC33_02575 [bacterium]
MKYFEKGLASIAICGLGAYAMYVSNGQTGIGWAILGIFIIWGH